MSGIVGISSGKSKIIGKSLDTASAWVLGNNETIGTIQESFNVSALDDDGTGLSQVHFIKPMHSTNYCTLLGNARWKSDTDGYVKAVNESYSRPRTTTAVAFTCTYTDGNGTNAHQDSIMFSVAVFGE